MASLPSTVKKINIYGSSKKIDNLEEIIKQFPYLINFNKPISIGAANKTQLKLLDSIMIETEEKFKLKPRRITVNPNNALQLNNHSELFERVEWVCIYNNEFNFDLLPSEIKKIEIKNEVDFESMTLNRFEKEREQV